MTSKITKDACLAFDSFKRFNRGNTNVTVEGGVAHMFLHGNLIATRGSNSYVEIRDAGFKSNTTRDRLNGLDGVNLRYSQGEWGLSGNHWDGKWISLASHASRAVDESRYIVKMDFKSKQLRRS